MGGAWIDNYQSFVAGTSNMFNGLNSYGYIARPEEVFSPYIDSLFVTLLEFVAQTAPAP